MVYAPVAENDRKNRLSPPLMYVFRTTHKAEARTGERAGKPARSDKTPVAAKTGKPQREGLLQGHWLRRTSFELEQVHSFPILSGIPESDERCDSFVAIAMEAENGAGLQPGFA
jgi:hypothetical protein